MHLIELLYSTVIEVDIDIDVEILQKFVDIEQLFVLQYLELDY